MNKLITQDPDILGGKPIIKGTRMSVESILELLASGMEINEILEDYPILKKEHVLAAIKYASKLVGKTESYLFNTAKTANSQATAHEVSRRR
ncbi:DUF433 domain-containing protein [Candidatus Daviesbacteria bacterium]|nr:DUF433 domain-containing protein [Candidatus Daviesbacteria bacterium]